MDAKTKELAAVSASVAGNCLPCLAYHFEQAVKLGCAPEDIDEVIELAKMIKNRPSEDILELSQQLRKRQVK